MIVVFGSINMDMVMRVKAFPKPGETLIAPTYEMLHGGKGANQALASMRMQARTAMVGKVGDDGMGTRLSQSLKRDGVMTSGIAVSDDLPTGMAYILTNAGGENQIVVASGANADVRADQIPDEILGAGNVLLMQMELSPTETVILMNRARAAGATVILNLAPFFPLPAEALRLLDWLIVNEGEAEALAQSIGVAASSDKSTLAKSFASVCGVNCIVTLGGDGAVAALKSGQTIRVASLSLEQVIDTTGAGDCFCGTFAACLHEKIDPAEAMRHASVAAGLSCLKKGAQDSYPYSDDIRDALKNFPAAEIS